MRLIKKKDWLLEDELPAEAPAEDEYVDPNAAPDAEQTSPEGELMVDDNGNVIDPNDPAAPLPDGMDPAEMPEEPAPELTGKFGNLKLYDLMTGLAKYVDIYIDAYNDIETDQLSSIQLSAISKSYRDVLKLKEDLKFYMMNDFATEIYKKNLYTYLMFNKRFSEIIERFRHTLHLNANELIKDASSANGKERHMLIEPGATQKH